MGKPCPLRCYSWYGRLEAEIRELATQMAMSLAILLGEARTANMICKNFGVSCYTRPGADFLWSCFFFFCGKLEEVNGKNKEEEAEKKTIEDAE